MRTLLVFPPQGHFTQPYLALPSLAAYLRANGHDDVHVMDANIEAYDYFLSAERLARSLDEVRRRGRLETLERAESLRYQEMVEYRRLTQGSVAGPWVVENVEEAKATLRDPEAFYDYDRYVRAARCLEQGLAMISAEHHPSEYSAHGFSMRHSVQVTDEILGGAIDERENPFLEFFREVTMPQIEALAPDVVGISLTFTSQAIPTVALASMIKAWRPETHVVVGGGLVAYLGPMLAHRADLFDTIDTLVRLEGERPMAEILEVLERGGGGDDFEGIANILYRSSAGDVRQTPEREPLSINTLPTPDFEGMPLEKYFSPHFVIPLAITRGCYWGKCAFCTLHKVIGPGYRGRSIERVVEDIESLRQRWGSRYFYFPIEDLPPNMVKRLPDALLEAELDIEWWCDAKLEPEVFTEETCEKLRESGCRRLAFGYESASSRVLNLMCKGSEPGPGMDVIRRVHDAGISVTLYVMVGFPTETREEADLTLSTLLENREHFEEVSIRVFYLDNMSDIFESPANYGVSEMFPDERADLQVYYDFATESGMSRREARQVYLKMLSALQSNLPVFQNRNVLYHELKSHYFLYLVEAGGVRELLDGVFSTRSETSASLEHPEMTANLRFSETRFDREEVDRALEDAQDGLILPRYQFDLIAGDTAAELDRTVPPVERCDAVLVFHEERGEVVSLSPDGAQLLRSCDGSRTISEILESYDEPARESVREFLGKLAEAELVQERVLEEVMA